MTKECQFGALTLAFTTQYSLRWRDKGSDANEDGAFYHPIPPEGFHALGSIGLGTYAYPAHSASICVKAAGPVPGHPDKEPLAPPEGFARVWTDQGSDANSDGSCWRPIAPAGYVALGDVFQNGYSEPDTSDVMCVAEELTWDGEIGDEIWTDAGSDADKDFGAWQITPSEPLLETPDGVFAVNSFVGVASHDRPGASEVAYNLRLPFPIEEHAGPAKPTLGSRQRPPAKTNPVVDRRVTVPFIAIQDEGLSFHQRITETPFYVVERLVDYHLLQFLDNETSQQQEVITTITSGVSKQNSDTFSIETGISVSFEKGVEASYKGLGASTKTTLSLSLSLGYSRTTAVTEFRSESDQAKLRIPPYRAAAQWVQRQEFQVRRADGTLIGQIAFDPTDTAYVTSQFPKTQTGDVAEEPSVERNELDGLRLAAIGLQEGRGRRREMVVLRNLSERPIRLAGWRLADSSGGEWQLAVADGVAAPDDVIRIRSHRRRPLLSGDGGEIALLNPAEEVVDHRHYGKDVASGELVELR